MLKTIYLIFLGLTSGCMVAAGTFAFIAAIGIVPRMAKRTETQRFIRVCATAMCLCGSDQFSPKLTWTGNAVTWKASAQPSEVANYNGTHYHLVALLDISAK